MKALSSIFVITISLFIFSCRTPRYVNAPAAINAPLLQQKGDSKLAAYYSSNFGNSNGDFGSNYNKSRGYDLQTAYALSNHWALQANYFFRSEINGGFNQGNFDSSSLTYKRKAGDIGVGYYSKVGNGDNVFQVFAGGGTGTYQLKDEGKAGSGFYNRFHNADVNKFYLQPAFMLVGNNLSFTLASRFSFINYKKITTDYTADEQQSFNISGLDHKTLSFWEPAMIFNFGFESLNPLRFELQFGGSFFIDNNYYDTKTGNISFGLVMDFTKLKKE